MTIYDRHYQTEELFGEPFPELIDFLSNHEPKGRLLDVGCGQGRNALAIAKLGYQITGIDESKVGIEQMLEKANSEDLSIDGIVVDIYEYKGYQQHDIILFDSMFHFGKKDREQETELIKRIANQIRSGALLCFCNQDTGSKIKILKETIETSGNHFSTVQERSMIYRYHDKATGHSSETKYVFYIVLKE